MPRIADWWETHQVPWYLAAIAVGAAVGLLVPSIAPALSTATTPVLAVLLFATFLAVPLTEVGRSFPHVRFLAAVLVVNFVVVPVVAFALSRFVADDHGLLLGLLLVLLTPCVDYVIVFTGLAGGANERLLAATPLLMVLQIVLLPVYLWLFAAGPAAEAVAVGPFVEAFVVIVLLPLAAAAIVQAISRRHPAGRAIERATTAAMVPLMMLTLAVVVGSQIAAVGADALTLLRLVPIYAAFAVVMVAVGLGAARVAGLTVPDSRAVVFSGVTRNSLVVLPLALALPAELAIAPLAVVTQTLVELLVLVALVRLVPRLTPTPPAALRAHG
jgi:ACR3 family arsenite efflux pump ArsB